MQRASVQPLLRLALLSPQRQYITLRVRACTCTQPDRLELSLPHACSPQSQVLCGLARTSERTINKSLSDPLCQSRTRADVCSNSYMVPCPQRQAAFCK